DLEPNQPVQEARRIRIEGNTTGPIRNFWLADKGVGSNVGDVTVVGNVMRADSGGLVFVFGPASGARGPFRFEGNTFRTSGVVNDEHSSGAFFFSHASRITIERNRLDV